MAYLDLFQQILVFFVLLVSVSSLDVVKAKVVAGGFNPIDKGPRQPGPFEDYVLGMATKLNLNPHSLKGGVEAIGPMGEHYRVQRVHEGLRIVLEDCAMFPEGSADLDPSAMTQLKWLMDIARGKMNYLEVRGFTSDTDADSVNGDHNLLGYLRAAAVAKVLVGNPQEPTILEGQLRISTRGVFDPIYPPDQAGTEPRLLAKNRRVEIIISDDVMIRDESGALRPR